MAKAKTQAVRIAELEKKVRSLEKALPAPVDDDGCGDVVVWAVLEPECARVRKLKGSYSSYGEDGTRLFYGTSAHTDEEFEAEEVLCFPTKDLAISAAQMLRTIQAQRIKEELRSVGRLSEELKEREQGLTLQLKELADTAITRREDA